LNEKTNRCVKKQVPKKKECPPDKKLNEKTNRCVKKQVPKKKECNEKTNRCVKAKPTLKPLTTPAPKPTPNPVTKPANQEKKQQTKQAKQLQKRITFQSNNVGNVKWMKPYSRPTGNNPIVPLTQQKVNVFGSELIDNNWITQQYEYWKKLSEIDKLFLLVYTAYGDVLVNTFLLKGVNGMNINRILTTNYNSDLEALNIVNPLFPLFVKYPDIFYDANTGLKNEYKKMLNNKLPLYDRYKIFGEIFKKLDKEFLEKTLEKYMNAYNSDLNRIIENSPKLKKEIIVARGSRYELNYDDKYKWTNRFTSTSISFNKAKKFGDNVDIYIETGNTLYSNVFE
jgi:hypothetical protein